MINRISIVAIDTAAVIIDKTVCNLFMFAISFYAVYNIIDSPEGERAYLPSLSITISRLISDVMREMMVVMSCIISLCLSHLPHLLSMF